MGEKLDDAPRAVNRPIALIALLALLAPVSSCGPSPRPVAPAIENAWPTPLGSARRAAFENEIVPDSLDVAWDINAGSGMRSGILVTDSALFVGTTNRQLLAFATASGRKHWDQRLEGELGELVRSGRTLFAATGEWNGRVHARDIERGRSIWRKNIGPSRNSLLLESGIVYAAADSGQVYALRSEDGAQIWRTNVRGSIVMTPVSVGEALIVATTLDTLYRIAKRDGAIVTRGHIPSSVSAPPAVIGDTLIVPTHSGAVLGVDGTTLQTRWRVDTGAPILAAPIVDRQNTIHVANRDVAIWRIRGGTGTKVAQLDGAITSSFTLARERYVVGMMDGTVLVTDLNGRIIAQHKFNDTVSAPVSVRGGALYVPLLRGRIVKLQ
ncbi:MAG TPA: PQQ-binding-like beta-propeller repeat protein [Longimicrobiales bacterium]